MNARHDLHHPADTLMPVREVLGVREAVYHADMPHLTLSITPCGAPSRLLYAFSAISAGRRHRWLPDGEGDTTSRGMASGLILRNNGYVGESNFTITGLRRCRARKYRQFSRHLYSRASIPIMMPAEDRFRLLRASCTSVSPLIIRYFAIN